MNEIRPIPTDETWAPSDRLWFWTRTVPFLLLALGIMAIIVLGLVR